MGASDALVQDSFSVLLSNHLICCARRVIIAGLEPANLTKNTKKTKNASLFNDFIGYYDFMFFWFYDRPMASWFLLVIASSMGRRWMNTLQIQGPNYHHISIVTWSQCMVPRYARRYVYWPWTSFSASPGQAGLLFVGECCSIPSGTKFLVDGSRPMKYIDISWFRRDEYP